MGIGSGIALMAIGAILYFAVDVSFGVVDVKMIGVILMIAGLAVSVISLFLIGRAPRDNRRGPGTP